MMTVSVILVLLVCPVWGAELDDALFFLRDKTPAAVYEKFSQMDINVSPCVVEDRGNVYSLSAVKVRTDKSANMQRALNSAALRQAYLRAAVNLVKYLDNHILLRDYEVRAGFSSALKIVNDTAFGLVWSKKVNAPYDEEGF